MKRNEIVLYLLFFLPASAWSQPGFPVPFKRHEFYLGYGRATSFERRVLGFPGRLDTTITRESPETHASVHHFFDFGYSFNFSRNTALGFQAYRWLASVNQITRENVPPMHLTVTYYGFKGRIIPFPGIAEPYVCFSANRTTGTLTYEGTEKGKVKGFAFGYGGGVNFHLEPQASLGFEVLKTYGVAHWEKGYATDFDPSILSVTIHVALLL